MYIDLLEMFEKDPGTEAILIIGEIRGNAEIQAAEDIKKSREEAGRGVHCPGRRLPLGKRMGHAGAIISGGKGTAAEKMDALKAVGVEIANGPADMGAAMQRAIAKRKGKLRPIPGSRGSPRAGMQGGNALLRSPEA